MIIEMKRRGRNRFLLIIAAFLVFALSTTIFLSANFLPRSYRSFLAGLMPIETITPENLKAAYAKNELKILLVPGHDNRDWGTEFHGLREADMNVEFAEGLYNILATDGHFQVFTTRDFTSGEYNPVFAEYFSSQEQHILSFRTKLKELIVNAVRSDRFQLRPTADHLLPHHIGQKLYGINKWANESGIHVTLHIHFNDHAGRRQGRYGDYEGFTIYIPERQFSSSRASRVLAESIFTRLRKNFAVSTLPQESQGITEDQDIIATGAKGSLDGVGLLIEYGYIYESQFVNDNVRQIIFRELVHQTYAGLKKYFEPRATVLETTLLPHLWTVPLKKGMKGDHDVLALQAALLAEGTYPPLGKGLSDCSLTGNFGSCTEAALVYFQEKYADDILKPFGFAKGTGFAGIVTLRKLNELYGAPNTKSLQVN